MKHNTDTFEEKQKLREVHGDLWLFDKLFGVPFYLFLRLLFVIAHSCTVYSIYQVIWGIVTPWKLVLDVFFVVVATLSITAGCHRLWAHKTYKATLPLQILLMLMHSFALQWTIYRWVLDHRIHHKYVDTDADPHNSKRGFWFSHIGWLVSSNHPDNQKAVESFRMADLAKDPVIRFQNRWFWLLMVVFHILLPVSAYCRLFSMTVAQAVVSNAMRWVVQLHATFTVNSFAHMWGNTKPYDKNISSVEVPLVSFLTTGEGWHNYHHTYPYDYKASEFPWTLNLATIFIDCFSWIGWAYDLKTVPEGVVNQRKHWNESENNNDNK